MRLLLLNDSHFGIRNDSPVFMDHFLRFYEQVLFPYLKKNPVDRIIILGDLMDRRRYVNYQTLHTVRKKVIDRLVKFAPIDIIAGNHDVMYKNTNEVNGLDFLQLVPNIRVFLEPVYDKELNACFIPWINSTNAENTNRVLNSAPEKSLLFGHLEIVGFRYMPQQVCQHGMESSDLTKFLRVFTGHFHSKQSSGNIEYLGTQYQMNFGDWDQEKGFHVYDTDSDYLEFIPNPHKIFFKIDYVEKTPIPKLLPKQSLKDCYIHVKSPTTYTPAMFDFFMEKIYEQEPASVTVEQEYKLDLPADVNGESNTLVESLSTRGIITRECESLSDVEKPEKLTNLLETLYDEAVSMMNRENIDP